MKSVLSFFAISLMSVAAMAWPTAGDQVNYDITISANGQTMAGQMSVAVQSINPAADVVTMLNSFNIAGQNRTQTTTARLSELTNLAASVPFVLANCQATGGVPEAVATPGGVFQACKVASNEGTRTGFAWVADVKFGWVKIDQTDSANGMRSIAVFRNQN